MKIVSEYIPFPVQASSLQEKLMKGPSVASKAPVVCSRRVGQSDNGKLLPGSRSNLL